MSERRTLLPGNALPWILLAPPPLRLRPRFASSPSFYSLEARERERENARRRRILVVTELRQPESWVLENESRSRGATRAFLQSVWTTQTSLASRLISKHVAKSRAKAMACRRCTPFRRSTRAPPVLHSFPNPYLLGSTSRTPVGALASSLHIRLGTSALEELSLSPGPGAHHHILPRRSRPTPVEALCSPSLQAAFPSLCSPPRFESIPESRG